MFYTGPTLTLSSDLAVCRMDSTHPPLSQSIDPSLRKEGKFRVLNHIFSKKKKDLHAAGQSNLSQDLHLQEETSEVDDIITTFDCVVDLPGKEDFKYRPNESESSAVKDHRCLPPIRTQSLPPIAPGNSLLSNSHHVPHRNVSGHRSQKSKSEHDLFDSRTKAQKSAGVAWKTESNQLLTEKAWVSSMCDRTLDKMFNETSPIDVLCSNHMSYIQRTDQSKSQHGAFPKLKRHTPF